MNMACMGTRGRSLFVTVAVALGLASLSSAQPQFVESSLSLGQVSTTGTGQGIAHLLNPGPEPAIVELITAEGAPYTASPGSAVLAAGQSVAITVQIQPPHNLYYSGRIVASGDWGACTLPVSASGDYPGTYWDATYNLSGTALKTQLTSLVSVQTPISYDAARLFMFSTLDNVNGWLECVYTGALVQSWGIPDNAVMNTEHSWPQSYGAEGDARSDLHHLYPCDSWTNSSRGNLPYGNVVISSNGYPRGGADRGVNAVGITVFEPRDQHKGDCARSMLYFALRYNNPYSFLNLADQEPVLRSWAAQDLVSTKEVDRNNGIDGRQHNRNPFVDQPGLLSRIASLSGSADLPPSPAQFAVYPDTLELDCSAGNCTAQIWLLNSGGSTLTLSTPLNDAPGCVSLGTAPTSLAAGAAQAVTVTVIEDCEGLAHLSFASSAGTRTLPVLWSTGPQPGLQPPLLQLESISGGRRLFWAPVVGATSYRVLFALDMNGPWYTLSTQSATQYVLFGEEWPSPSLFKVISIGN